MTRIEYDLLREREPQLRFPMYELLLEDSKQIVAKKTIEELVASRAVTLLVRQPGVRDKLKKDNPYE
jgi:hypothetical protein